jgi:nudix-type nucleoside diphosphatase (YffH/AdpP family)
MSIEILDRKVVHEGWAKYSVLRLRIGGHEVKRELEEHGPAIAVLPYDPERRTAILVRQFRAPVYVGTGEPSFVEAMAGLTDGEDPVAAARREASEETGLRLDRLEHVGQVWTMPGLSAERMDLFLATYGAADRVGQGGGAEGEHENITVLELPLRELAQMADHGELTDMKTFALLQTLRLRRPELFQP